jgi:hypothetical protein
MPMEASVLYWLSSRLQTSRPEGEHSLITAINRGTQQSLNPSIRYIYILVRRLDLSRLRTVTVSSMHERLSRI